MAVTVRVMNWNVQNFGPAKAGIKFGNYDVVLAIAKLVVESKTDILVLLELNTTSRQTATDVASNLLQGLHSYSYGKGRNEWNVCVLSPNTGTEFYGFFVRDAARTVPMPISAPVVGTSPVEDLGPFHPAATAEFTAVAANATGVQQGRFPLLHADLPKTSSFGRPMGIPLWPGTRYPVLGLFWVPQASAVNRMLPIFACHFAPNSSQANSQILNLPYFSVLNALRPGAAAPVSLKVTPPGGMGSVTQAINYFVITGDFNIDFRRDPHFYTALMQKGPLLGGAIRLLEAEKSIKDPTHLVTTQEFNTRDYKTTKDLAINAFDNFFTMVNPATPATVTFGGAEVPDVPAQVKNRSLTLRESVTHYEELDQRGFSSRPYQNIIRDAASQLTGDKSHLINLRGALVGGRLISDHLPTVVDITLN